MKVELTQKQEEYVRERAERLDMTLAKKFSDAPLLRYVGALRLAIETLESAIESSADGSNQ